MADSETTQPPAANDAANQTQAPAAEPDSRRVRIVRVERDDGPATCISYDDGSGSHQQWHPDPAVNQFEVKAIIADAAVKTGFFVEAPDSKTRLKAVKKEN